MLFIVCRFVKRKNKVGGCLKRIAGKLMNEWMNYCTSEKVNKTNWNEMMNQTKRWINEWSFVGVFINVFEKVVSLIYLPFCSLYILQMCAWDCVFRI